MPKVDMIRPIGETLAMNRICPSTNPCGNPDVDHAGEDEDDPTHTVNLLPVKCIGAGSIVVSQPIQ